MIPKLTKEQELESFESDRLSQVEGDRIVFTKRNLARLCLQEIDHAIGLINSVDIKDVKEQFAEEKLRLKIIELQGMVEENEKNLKIVEKQIRERKIVNKHR